jgi:hypothetical protein
MMEYTNRYRNFLNNETQRTVPFVAIPEKATDKYPVYTVGKSRLDKMSLSFYGNPYHGWLILLANPEFSKENEITDGALLRVPFPLNQSLRDYNDALLTHKKLYGE